MVTRLALPQAGNCRASLPATHRTHWRKCKPKSIAPIGDMTHVRGIGPAKLSPPLLTSTYLTKFRKNAAKACMRLGLPQRLSKCCQNQAQRPEAVTATRWLLATAERER